MSNWAFKAISSGQEITVPKSMADVVYEKTGRRICDVMPLADLSEAISRAERTMQVNLSKSLYPHGREAYVAEFNQKFGLTPNG